MKRVFAATALRIAQAPGHCACLVAARGGRVVHLYRWNGDPRHAPTDAGNLRAVDKPICRRSSKRWRLVDSSDTRSLCRRCSRWAAPRAVDVAPTTSLTLGELVCSAIAALTFEEYFACVTAASAAGLVGEKVQVGKHRLPLHVLLGRVREGLRNRAAYEREDELLELYIDAQRERAS